ncbi:related to taurine dioxygenase [Ramularia collo-cygni]|uniref:Related to taurine dioxygenase n=1 Tax=Ramularia collo-cygni TaxID=112498 RepID=A0A2D3V8Z2_9PEZI|nr:related to taurine dioxygenase [Ramularia collo-cygni]CZT21910.1 related to taurine dioxygenase [Ramularia collo-cygni]
MAPGAVDTALPTMSTDRKKEYPTPIKPSGSLDAFEYEDSTPIIGREYLSMNIVNDILQAPNSTARIRDLAHTISSRGVVFFRKQSNLTIDHQKSLVHLLGLAAGKPAESTLHIHPVMNHTSSLGVGDAEISHISSTQRAEFLKLRADYEQNKQKYNEADWHSDVQFERVPPDYTSLRLTKLPTTGGDTVWASGYEIYDRCSPAYRKFLEGLTATFDGSGYNSMGSAVYKDPRGNPQNVEFTSIHPVVRTNSATGWKSVMAIGPFPTRINELTSGESEAMLKSFKRMIVENHDLCVRFKWRNENDIAIWDNRCTFHSGTYDYEGLGERYGHRAVGIGEPPYLDPQSKSRREDLAEKGE